MPQIDHDRIIYEYYQTIREQYPELSLMDVTKMCKSLFNFVKETISGEKPSTIRLKYLGQFTVFPQRMINLLAKEKTRLELGYITPEEYEVNVNRYQKVLDDITNSEKDPRRSQGIRLREKKSDFDLEDDL